MATQLVVRYGNLKHRLVATTKVELTLTGPPEKEVAGSTLGNHIFDIAAASVGNSFKLTIEIPATLAMAAAGAAGSPLLSITQNLEVIRTKAGIVTLQPHPTSPGNRFTGGFHPRLQGQLAASGAGHLYFIDVDNTFIKVNRLAGATNSAFVEPYVRSTTPFLTGAAPHYGCRLTLYEYTGGRPVVWPVLIPPAVKEDAKTVHALMFFRPATTRPNDNIENADSLSLLRYVLDPSPVAPFFVDTRKPTPAKIEIVSNCGFERSLSEANKGVVFVSPLPHGSDYGHTGTVRWPQLMKSLIVALWSENDIGQKVPQGLVLGRTAAGGFSFGGLLVFLMLKVALALKPPAKGLPQPDPLHELYLFDCREFTATDQDNIRKWFAKGGKKLRMIGGGLFHGKMLALAASMKSPDATVIPSAADDWLTDPLYKAAVSFHKFDPSSALGPTTGSVSDRTGLFLAGPSTGKPGVALEGRDTSSAIVIKSQNVVGFGAEELTAGAMLYHDGVKTLPHPNGVDKEFAKHKPPDTPPQIPLRNATEGLRLITTLEGRCKAIRHQWAVVGGQDSAAKTDRLATFSGFLRICLEKGDLP